MPIAVVLALALAACGGSSEPAARPGDPGPLASGSENGDGEPAAPSAPPASAAPDPRTALASIDAEALYRRAGCVACHDSGVGPPLVGLSGRVVELTDGSRVAIAGPEGAAYLRASLLDPTAQVVSGYPPVMPTFRTSLANDEIEVLVDWLRAR